ncbi:N-acetyltransferase [Oceaniglobus ichthyenteri]|uniref:N-acetyltransferase n=1 Tax=Oceaniglobus ichthyenteri TaxID=2136177 RepID=UPI000D34008D|nr:acyltransferase [Oceaniglobus ichthyenteri]
MIHPTAIISPDAKLGAGVKIGAYSIIGDMAEIGAGSEIGSHCEVGVHAGVLPPGPLVIGANSLIRSGSIIYQNSTFGEGLTTGHRVTLREGIIALERLQVGTLSDLQGHCSIGRHVRLHSNVHIGQNSKIGDFVWIFPYVVLTNDPHPPSEVMLGCIVKDFAVVATMSTILPGITVGSGALVGAMTLVREDVPADTIHVGVPGRNVGSTLKVKFKDSGEHVYPWRRHFHRGYPAEAVKKWRDEFPQGELNT